MVKDSKWLIPTLSYHVSILIIFLWETLEHNLFYAFAINAEVPDDNEGQRKYTGSN